MTFEKLFVSLDILAPPIRLNIDGSPSFKTRLGAVLTILFAMMITVSTGYIFSNSLRRDIPISNSEATANEEFPRFDLRENSIVPVFVAYLGDTDIILVEDLPKYLTIDLIRITWITDSGVSPVSTTKKVQKLPTKPCNELTPKEQEYLRYISKESYVYSLIEESGMCPITDDDFYVQGKGADDFFQTVTLRLRPCSLASGCVSSEEVSRVNFYLILPGTALDPADYEGPHSQIVTAEFLYYLNPGSVQMQTQSVRRVNVFNYEGIIPTWNKFYTYSELGSIFTTTSYRDPTKVSCTPQEAEATVENSCRSYFEFNIQASGQSVSVKRRYKTVTETFGEIGGVKEVIIIDIGSFYAFFHSKYFDRAMISKVYSGVQSMADEKAKKAKKTAQMSCCGRLVAKVKSWFSPRSEMEEFAAHSIEESLDVVRIINELNKLHVLANFILSDKIVEEVPKLALLLRRLRLREAMTATLKPKSERMRLRKSKCVNLLKEDLEQFGLKVITREYMLRSQSKGRVPDSSPKKSSNIKYPLATGEDAATSHLNNSSLVAMADSKDQEQTKTKQIGRAHV